MRTLLSNIIQFLGFGWPVTFGLLALIGISFLPTRRSLTWPWRSLIKALLACVATISLLVLLSVVFERESATSYPVKLAWPGYVVVAIWFVHVAVSGFIAWADSVARIRLLPTLLFLLWISFGVSVLAFMAVSGAASL